MRFVAVKSEAQQAAAMAYRTRDLLVRQRTKTINALRAHLAEQGIVAPTGPAHVGRLAAIIDGDDGVLPAAVRAARRSGCDGRDNRDESDAPGADRGEGVARTKVCPGGALRRPSG